MQAAQLLGPNQTLQLEEVIQPQPGPDEALVQLHAAALNHRDVWIKQGQYPGIRYPFILGSDGADEVQAVSGRQYAHLVGEAVLINPSLEWGDNPLVQSSQYNILGLPRSGTFAQYVVVPTRNLHPKPAHLSFAEAAALPLAGLTAYRAVSTRANVQPGERVLVTGIGGGVALFALQFAIALGAEVWVTSGSEEKIARAVALGAKGGTNYRQEGWEKQLVEQAGGPFAAIIDGAAGDGFAKLVDAAAVGGRIVFYGGTAGKINNLVPGRVFWKQLNIMGSTMGNDQEFASMVKLVANHRLRPVIDTVLPFAEISTAIQRMEEGQQFGKLVVTMR